MKNGAGVACRPESRAAFRLKAFETRPDASSIGPSDGSKASATIRVEGGTDIGGPRELGAGEDGGQATDTLIVLCLPLEAKESALRLKGRDGPDLSRNGHGFSNP